MSTILRFQKISMRILRGYSIKPSTFQQRYAAMQNLSVVSSNVFKKNYNRNNDNNDKKPLEVLLALTQQKIQKYDIIHEKDITELIDNVTRSGYIPTNHTLFMLRCCGNFTCTLKPKKRQEITEELWSFMKNKEKVLDVSVYNALLQIYIENEQEFIPENILQEMETRNIEPNWVTFDRMIQYYCNKGDIKNATKLIALMNDRKMSVTPSIFNSLIIGHAKAGDMESSYKILDIMKQGDIQPDGDTYGALMQIHAISGDMQKIKELIEECNRKEICISESHFVKVIEQLADNNHFDCIKEVVSYALKTRKFNMEMIMVIMKMLHRQKFDAVLELLNHLTPSNIYLNTQRIIIQTMLEHFILYDSKKVLSLCDKIRNTYLGEKLITNVYITALWTSIKKDNLILAKKILEKMKELNMGIQEHYFWPILCQNKLHLNINGTNEVMKTMISDFNIQPCLTTLSTYYIPFVPGNNADILSHLRKLNIDSNRIINAMILHKIENRHFMAAFNLARSSPSTVFHPVLIESMSKVLSIFNDAKRYVEFARYIKENHDDKYTYSDGITMYEEEPENMDLNDFIAKTALKAIPSYKVETAVNTFELMKEYGLGISKETAEAVKNYFNINDDRLNNVLNDLTNENLTLKPIDQSKVWTTSLNEIFEQNDLEKANSLRKELESMGQQIHEGMFVKLIHLHLNNNKIAEAKELVNEMKAKFEDLKLRDSFVLKYALHMIKNNDTEDGIAMLRDYYHPQNETSKGGIPHLEFNVIEQIIALENETLENEVLEILLKRMNRKSQTQVLKKYIELYITKYDSQKVLKQFEKVCTKYNNVAGIFILMKHFIANEDAANLQNVMNICCTIRGEAQTLFYLVMTFLEVGKLNQVKKLISTPSFQCDFNFVYKAALYFQKTNKWDLMEKFLDLTSDFNVNPYEASLKACIELNNWENGLALWTFMQQKNVIPSPQFLYELANLLKRNNAKVTFALPESVSLNKAVNATP